MKGLFVAFIASAAFCGAPALAADMPVKAPLPPPAPVYSWTGFYVGGNGGYEWTKGSTFPLTGTQSVAPIAGVGVLTQQALGGYPLTSNLAQHGAGGGLQAGYNWQFNSLVMGVEADFDLSSASRSVSAVIGPVGLSASSNISRRLEDLGTLRARVGFANGRTLLFATGGLAYGRSDLGYSLALDNGAGTGGAALNSTTVWQTGWTLGAGIEYAVWDHWSAKAEYLRYDLGTQSTTIAAASPPAFNSWTATTTVRNNGNLVRTGLNYKF